MKIFLKAICCSDVCYFHLEVFGNKNDIKKNNQFLKELMAVKISVAKHC